MMTKLGRFPSLVAAIGCLVGGCDSSSAGSPAAVSGVATEGGGLAALAAGPGMACAAAANSGLNRLNAANMQFAAGQDQIQGAIVHVANACPNRERSWLDQALTQLAACEAACSAAHKKCTQAPDCGFFCQVGCNLDQVTCNAGCLAVFSAQAADCVLVQ
ncbi:MAG: hypothetical protein HYW52_03610 [Gemmatimonadetes bacterium]|nr:hypothetical protein [Gemmatimonadota bacterium]MBI2403665.1 hypothetical protein [Gemmatimonadota bacterium]MBI2614764.1 hypothetical protein [Gemmatimonadota bacterium]